MFKFSDNGLLFSKYAKKREKQIKLFKEKNIEDVLKSLSEAIKPKNKNIEKLNREKEIATLEEQTELLKKIYNKLPDNNASGIFNVGKGGLLLGGASLTKKLIKKGGFLAPIFAAISEDTQKHLKEYAKEKGIFYDEVSLKDRVKAVTSTLGDNIVSIANSGLKALNIDYQIPENKTKYILDTVDNKITNIFNNFVDNTGLFGNIVDKTFSFINQKGGEFISNAIKEARMKTDVFMKQTKDWKEFIKVVEKASSLEGSKGYVSDEDKKDYDTLRSKATILAKKLQNNKDFVNHSGYQFVAQNLLDPARRAKIDYQMSVNKLKDYTSISTKAINLVRGKRISKYEILKLKEESKNKYIDYINKKRKHYNISEYERREYNKIIREKRSDIEKQIQNLKTPKEEIVKLDKAIEINKKLIEQDSKNKDIYLKNIDEAEKRRQELLKQQDENIKRIEELQIKLNDLIVLASTKSIGENIYNSIINNNTNGAAKVDTKKLKVVYPDGTVKQGGHRNWRNNNPGNIEYGKFAKAHGAIGSDGRFAIFPDMETGYKAQEALLKSKNYRNLTLSQAISRYAPRSENNTTAYINSVVKQTGVNPNVKISELSQEQLHSIVVAMSKHEGLKPGKVTKIANSNLSNNKNILYTKKESNVNKPAEVTKIANSNLIKLNRESNNTLIKNKSSEAIQNNNDIIEAINKQTEVLSKHLKNKPKEQKQKKEKRLANSSSEAQQVVVNYTPSRQSLKGM